MERKTLVVNIYGGPGTGKSTAMASIFSNLKIMGINCEMAPEYAKDKVWEESFYTLDNQIYVFGKQLHRIFRLLGKVDVVITDSPLPISLVYDKNKSIKFKELVMETVNGMETINFLLKRDTVYERSGRLQTEEEAHEVDKIIEQMLNDNNINYIDIVKGDHDVIIDNILEFLSNNKKNQ